MKRVNAITFLNYFVSGSLTLIIPLLLLAHNVNIADIGIVLSILPLVFLIARLFFAAIADYVGWSHVFLLINWPSTFLSCSIYYFASSLPAFALGKFVESLRESSYWAVSRTAIYHLSPKKAGNEATKNNATIWLATAFGGGAAGIGIASLGFNSTIAVLAIVSTTIGIPAFMLWKSSATIPIPKTTHILAPLNPKGRTRTFWLVSIAIMFNSLAIYPLTTLLLPAFMNQQLAYSYITIGVLFMFYNAISAITTYLTVKYSLNFARAAILTVISITASVFLGSSTFFIACLLALAFVRGYGIGFFEHTVLKVAKGSKNISVDIGLLHAPMRIAEFSSMISAGFLVQYLGYTPIFLATGIFFGVYCFLSLFILKYK
ncbi:MAG: MFS transporter [Candidatus Bathyarchaeia archaeon]